MFYMDLWPYLTCTFSVELDLAVQYEDDSSIDSLAIRSFFFPIILVMILTTVHTVPLCLLTFLSYLFVGIMRQAAHVLLIAYFLV